MSSSSRSMNSKPLSGKPSGFARNGNQNSKNKANKNKRGNNRNVVTSMGIPRAQQRSVPVAAFNSRNKNSVRQVTANRDCKVVSNSEFLGSCPGSIALTNQFSFAVNPGLSATFPWLSLEAVGWERYRFRKCHFTFETATSTAATGDVIIAPDYDASDAAPATEVVAMDYKDRAYGPPWAVDPIICKLDPQDMNGSYKEHFIRNGALAANLDIKTYDVANVFYLTGGQAGTSTIGKVFCDYTVEFYNPQLPAGGSPLANEGTLAAGGGSIAAATPFGAVPTGTGVILLSAAATNVVTFSGLTNGSEYSFCMNITGTVITAAPTFGTLVGLTLKNALFTGFPAAATTAAAWSTFTATATTASLTVSITATTVTNANALMTLVSPASSF